MKALVTGASGFLGQALARALLAQGAQVRSLARHPSSTLAALGVDAQLGSVADPGAVDRAVEGMDVVFHTAAKAGAWGPRREYETTNIEGTKNVLSACRTFGVRSCVYTSSPSVVTHGVDLCGVDERQPYPERYEADYPRTKACAERLVLAANSSGLSTVALRPHLIWGPGDTQLFPRVVARARSGRLVQVGNGRNIVDVTYIDDAVRAHLRAALCLETAEGRLRVGGKAYFLSSGTPLPLWQMVGHFLAIEGLAPPKRTIPLWLAVRLGAAMERVYTVLGRTDEPRITRWVAHELGTSHWFDIGAAKRDLGWEPQMTVALGLERLAASVGRVR